MTAACATTPVTEGTPEQKVGWVGNTPYAAMPELESVTNGTNAYVYWRIARLFALCELENFRDDNDWTDMKISERPVLVYDALSHPKYYEYRVLNGGTECGAIVCIAQKKDGEPTAYVLRYAPDYSGLLDYPANYRVIADGYPKVGYAPVDGVYAAKSGVKMFEEELTETVVSNVYGHWETNVTTSYVGGYEEYSTNYNWYSDLIEDTNFYWMTNVSEISAGVWETNIARFSTRWTTNVVLVSSDPEVWETNYQFLDTRYLTNWVCSTNLNSYWTGGETVIESNIYWVEDGVSNYYTTNITYEPESITNYEVDPLQLAILHPEYFTNMGVSISEVMETAKEIIASNQMLWQSIDKHFSLLIYFSTNDEIVHQKYLESKTKARDYYGGKVVSSYLNCSTKWWNWIEVKKRLRWDVYGLRRFDDGWCAPTAAAMMIVYYDKYYMLQNIITNYSKTTFNKKQNKYTVVLPCKGYMYFGSSDEKDFYLTNEILFKDSKIGILNGCKIAIESVIANKDSYKIPVGANINDTKVKIKDGRFYIISYIHKPKGNSDITISYDVSITVYNPNNTRDACLGDIIIDNNIYQIGYSTTYNITRRDTYVQLSQKMGITDFNWGYVDIPEKIISGLNWAYSATQFSDDFRILKYFDSKGNANGNATEEGKNNTMWLKIKALVNNNDIFILIRNGGLRLDDRHQPDAHARIGIGYRTSTGSFKRPVWHTWFTGYYEPFEADVNWVLLTDGNGYESIKDTKLAADKIPGLRLTDGTYTFWERVNWSTLTGSTIPFYNQYIIYKK